MNGITQTFREIAQLWAPPPKLTVTEWADSKRRLSPESSARSGQWQTRPYQREPMDVFTDPTVHTIVMMVARQTLKTEIELNCLGYAIDQDPGPMLVVQFRDTDCKKWSKIRLAPMLRDTPCLRGKVSVEKSRSGENTFEYKAFPGGHLSVVASASPGNLAALPIRYLFCDEIDKYPASAGGAGDPISMAQGRQEEFWNRKTMLACTPTAKGYSRIEQAYEESDKREYELRCPRCGEFQAPKWSQVKWESAAPTGRKQCASARYVCSNRECSAEWSDVDRWAASLNGSYRATAPFNGIAGFRVSGLARLGTHLSALVDEYLRSKGNNEARKTFINEQLAELWEEPGEAPEYRTLIERREKYTPGTVPAGGLILTAGVDIQRDRIEVEIVAWGRNRESWSIDYRILEGRTSEPAVWAKLADVVNETFPHESGARLLISRMFVDSGDGTMTNDVYAWVRTQPEDRVTAIKGDDRAGLSGVPVSQPSSVDVVVGGRKFGLKLKRVAVSFFKGELYSRLRLRPPTPQEREQGIGFPPGYCHFPEGKNYGDEHFRQLTAEQLVSRKLKNGRQRMEWRKDGRNEALDCRNYARAAGWDCGVDQAQESHWKALEDRLAVIQPNQRPPAASDRPAGRNPRFRMETN